MIQLVDTKMKVIFVSVTVNTPTMHRNLHRGIRSNNPIRRTRPRISKVESRLLTPLYADRKETQSQSEYSNGYVSHAAGRSRNDPNHPDHPMCGKCGDRFCHVYDYFTTKNICKYTTVKRSRDDRDELVRIRREL